ncbi:MAG: HAD family phosphatase [candidate division Zixibacteria bacterium]|nr:HAD family phosphatase [candidate division Zixibacteria bacterium]
MITTIICDLDGTLVNTECHHMSSYQEVFKKYNINLSDEEYRVHWIRDGKTIREFVKKHNINHDPKELHRQKSIIYKQKIESNLDLCEGAFEFLENIKNDFRLALATNSFYEFTNIILQKTNIKKFFNIIVTRDKIKSLKPDPEIFIKTAELLNVNVSDCLVLEDAQKGIEAASAAGMKSIAIPNIYTFDNDFSKADLILKSLKEINHKIIKNI